MEIERHLGTFGAAPALEKTGELVVDGRNTRLKLFGQQLDHLDHVETIYGRTDRNLKVSCLGCFVTSSARPFFDHETHVERIEIFPNFSITGSEHLHPEDLSISEAQFTLTDVPILFKDKKAFGAFTEASEDLQLVFDKRKPGEGQYALENSIISYFNGNYSIIEIPTAVGHFKAFYQFNDTRYLNHKITLSLRFDGKIKFATCLERVLVLRRFFTVVTGRPQALSDFEVFVDSSNPATYRKHAALKVNLSNSPNGPASPTPSDFSDAPVHPIRNKSMFATVMQNWLARDDTWFIPRRRYVECLEEGTHYSSNRLVAAANMFDILPTEAIPREAVLEDDFNFALSSAVEMFGKLPRTDLRDSLVGHLKRLKNPSLPAKMYHRSAVVRDLIQSDFNELNDVLRIAARFRNFFVHGGDFDYRKYEEFLPFLTNTLEFVFAAADLVEAGWSANHWHESKIWGNHQFTTFRRSYQENIAPFMAAKGGPRLTPKRK